MNRKLYIPVLLAISVCFACSDSSSSLQNIDDRVKNFDRFKRFFKPDIWEREKRTDKDDRSSIPRTCVPPSVSEHKKRIALNLAGSRHFDEAVRELSAAISEIKKEKGYANSNSLAELYLLRSNLNRAKGDRSRAISDLNQSLESSPKDSSNLLMPIALCQMKLGQNEEAENTFSESISKSKYSTFVDISYYFLATVQEKQGKLANARNSYRQAAKLFLASGASEPAKAAIEKINSIRDSNNIPIVKTEDISPPIADKVKVEKLLKAATGDLDLFNSKEVKELTGINLADFRDSGNFYEFPFNPHRRLFERVNLKYLGKKKQLQISIDPTICSFLKKDAEPFISNLEKTEAPRRFKKGYAYSEAYKVERGTLILSWMSGGFNALKQIDLFSKHVDFPYSNHEQWYPQRKRTLTPAQQSHQKSKLLSIKIDNLIKENKLNEALDILSRWEKESPKEYAVHYKKFQVFDEKKEYQKALNSLKKAKAYATSDYTREFLNPKFASVLISLEKYQSALDFLEKVDARHLDAEYFFLLGRAQLGSHRFSEAKKNLDIASEKYYNSGLIVKRDEVEALKKKLPVLF